ncbi:uncharacterized protein LOC121245039 isoform X1 [Juglans microcarpa x Juglans regia]|uniref:uncharacterized protein LOC121245039 isoform X1 n=2 Tax=Juglans microcarpa x Juglans regia TaxID=2249226 RepID=UPI001B7E5EFA|nr:uncharacterized protein LOC121245039 isoform X1 [Juglans microcarpa x Juglans regia]
MHSAHKFESFPNQVKASKMINTCDVVQLLPISSFKFNDNTEEMRGKKTEEKTSVKSESSIISGVRREGYEVDSDLLPGDSQNEDPVRNPPEVSSLIAWEDSEDKRDRLAEYFNCPKDLKGSEEGENLYTRENIMEYELPELDVFFHESSYQFVKDICIDSGVTSQGKCLLETYELDHTTLSCILNSDVDTSSELTEETLDTASFGTNGSRHSTEQDCNKDVIKQCACEGLTMKGEIDIDAGHEISDQSHKKIISKILLLDREAPFKEAVSENLMASSTTEANDNSHPIFNSEVEPESLSNRFNSSTLTINSGEDSLLCVSKRSTSSTASSRSFAFPILPAEWNGSPVRMVRADRVQLRKHRRWRLCFPCLKF